MEYTLEVLLSVAACCRTPFGYRCLNNRWVEGPKLSAVDWMPNSISSNFQKTSTMDDTDTWTGFTMCLTKVNSDPKQVTLSRSEPVQPASP